MERGNLRVDVKGVCQVYEPQGKSTDATIGAEWIVVVKIAIERWKERRIRSIQALRVSQLET